MIVYNKGEEKANIFVGKAPSQAAQTIAFYPRPLRARLYGDLW
jgi:hypothetical protein